jgi:hypothetical protein
MSTTPNPLQPQTGPYGMTLVPPQAPQPQAAAPQQRGFFGKIGTVIKNIAPYIGPIADSLAAAGGNYAPMEMRHQQREDSLRQLLAQSQIESASLNRKMLQQQYENYESPAQQRAAAVTQAGALEQARAANAPPTETTSTMPDNQVGRFSKKYNPATGDFDIRPEMATQQVPNPTQAPGAGMPPPLGGRPLVPPSPTVNQRFQLTVPQQVGHYVSGYDKDGNPVLAEYSKGGAPLGNQPAPTPAGVAVPTSPWKTYLLTGRKQGLSDADIVNKWNTQESSRTGIKMVPQPDGSIAPVPVTEGSVSQRSPLGSSAQNGGAISTPSAAPPTRPTIPGVRVGTPGAAVGGRTPKPVTDAFTTYNQSQERSNVMQHALPDALGGDQQAMLNLLANHLGMTMGLQKGARMNQALIEEAMKSAPWLQGMQARFDSRGYLSGVVLTPAQMNSMVKLAQDRADQDFQGYQRAQGEARRGFGMNAAPPAGPATLPKIPPRNADEYLNSLPQ